MVGADVFVLEVVVHQLLAALALLAAPALAAGPTPLTINGVRAVDPPHCLSAGQWKDAVADAPFALFDGTANRAWVICPEAVVAGYSVDFTFAAPITIDALRLHPGPKRTNHPAVVEIGLHNTQLSKKYPISFRRVKLDGPKPVEVALQGRLAWNPRLLDDEAFADRRRALGLSAHDVPLPIQIDKVTIVLREVDASAGLVHLGELTFRYRDATVPVRGLAKAERAHRTFVGDGLRHVLSGRFLVGQHKVVHLAKSGQMVDVLRTDWDAGRWFEPKHRETRGAWRVVDGRLEMIGLKDGAEYLPVEYRIDDAPGLVALRDGPAEGTWQVLTGAPRPGAAPVKATAALGVDTEDDSDELVIPIP
jgi:hypothetical protein